MKEINCWEVLKCGRQPGGDKAEELGLCPAAQPGEFDGINDGTCGGRFCWAVSGTLCGGKVQGTYAKKLKDCLKCEFLKRVHEETGRDFILTKKNARRKV